MNKFFKYVVIVLSLAGICFSFIYFPKLYPEWNLSYKLNRGQAKDLAKKEIESLGYDLKGYSIISYFEINTNLLNYINSKYSFDSLRKVLSVYKISNYKIQAFSEGDVHDVTISSKREIDTKNFSKTSFELLISSDGKILKFDKKYPKDTKLKPTDSTYAWSLCDNYLNSRYKEDHFAVYDVKKINTLEKSGFVFYARSHDILKNELIAQIEISNNEISGATINYSFELETNFKSDTGRDQGYELLSLIFIILLFLILITLMIRRIKNDEINFKFGLILGLTLGLLFTISSVFSFINQGEVPGLILLVPIIFIFLFMGALFVIILSGTDSVARYYWNNKFYSFDALSKGYLFVSKVRKSIFNGFIAAGILLLSSTLFNYIVRSFFKLDREIIFDGEYNSIINILGNNFSILYIIFPIIAMAVIYSYGGPLFITSLFKMKIKNNLSVLALSILVIATIDTPTGCKPHNFYAHIIYAVMISFLIICFFVKYDLLSIITALFFEQIIFNISKFYYFHIEGSDFNFYVLVGVILLFVVIYIVSYFYKKDINYEELTPAIVKRITERERIVKEIEAARHIQQSFLPDRIPDIKGLDIGSVCLPAYEVGGDYYDLFKIDDNKLAIVIGDVSGKGIKAAFYMTLVKGIIKAQSLMYSSPAEILSKANKIFFELVEKGNFISLIYGIFDLENKFLIYGNAGHNHIIIKEISKGGIRFDKTEGIALGLSEDPIFTNNIKEQVINFRPGDTFVFYTDGVVEAMNKDRMEYGNERFLDLINEISINSASEIVTIITQRVKKFIGKADQHDDLTLLVVKIK